ncbi:MAG: hypothetical protein ACJ8OJ_02225 [Povalibacter sp.]
MPPLTKHVYLVDAEGRLHATFFDASVERMSKTVRSLDERKCPLSDQRAKFRRQTQQSAIIDGALPGYGPLPK